MSTTSTIWPETPPTQTPPVPPAPPVETAPSAIVGEGPTFARIIGFLGLGMFVTGLVVVIATNAVGTPRLISEGLAYLIGATGLVLMLFHASVDKELELRRVYGGVAAFLLIAAVVLSLLPGGSPGSKHMGYYLLPWGIVAGLGGLLFTVAASRHETDARYRDIANNVLLGYGSLLVVGSVTAGIFKPDFLAGPGLALSLLGVGFICGYFTRVDTSDGIGYTVAFALGVVGALTIVYAIGRAVVPTVLYDGPGVLRKPDQKLDNALVLGRGILIFGFLCVVAVGAAAKRLPLWLRGSMAAVGLAGAILFIVASTGSYRSTQPTPFLVPGGVTLMGLGLVYLAVSLGVCSDSQFVTLTRRELSAYFLTPIGYLVLGGMVLAQWLAYVDFVGRTLLSGRAVAEPIVEDYGAHILNLFIFAVQIPILTMRLLAEEKRTGSLEVLLTAPVNEASIVCSKFLGTLIFFLVCWLPLSLFLIALSSQGTQPFDYRPMLGFYVCLAAQGAMFIAMGLFFSSLTKNQIVAAVLTFVVMESLLFFALLRFNPVIMALPDAILSVAERLSFYHVWRDALEGQLPIRDVLLSISLAVFGLFVTIKILEVRKWS